MRAHFVWTEGDVQILAPEKVERGGEGSGNFGHAGRPGEVGGSAAGEGGSPPTGQKKLTGYHTSLDANYPFPQRGRGYYIALDKPFEAWRGTDIRHVSVSLDPKHILDPNGLIEGTDVLASQQAFRDGHDRVNEMSREDVDGYGGAYEALHAVYGEMGYEAEAGWIEPEAHEFGRELVVWDPSKVDRGEIIKRGGEGSGNFGHAGRPGEVGGSAAGEGAVPSEHLGRLTKAAVGRILQWSSSRYNEYNKAAAIEIAIEGLRERKEWRVLEAGAYTPASGHMSGSDYLISGQDGYIATGFWRGTGQGFPGSGEFEDFEQSKRYYFDVPAVERGGPGSGHHGHAGRPGERGGSLPGEGGSEAAGQTAASRKVQATGPLIREGFRAYHEAERIGSSQNLDADQRGPLLSSEHELSGRSADQPERAYVIRPDGEVLFDLVGQGRDDPGGPSVFWTDEQIAQMDGAVLTHSHPSGRGFSRDDIAFASVGHLAEMRAVGTDYAGRTWLYRFQPGPDASNYGWQTLTGKIGEVDRALFDEWSPRVHEDLSVKDWADLTHGHEVMLRLAQQNPGIVGFYSRERLK